MLRVVNRAILDHEFVCDPGRFSLLGKTGSFPRCDRCGGGSLRGFELGGLLLKLLLGQLLAF